MCMHSDKKHISWKMMFGSCAAWRISNTIVLKNEKRTRTKSWVTHMQFRLHLAISVSMALLRWTQSCIRCQFSGLNPPRAQVQQIGNKIVPNESYVIPWANVQLIKWFYVSVLNCKLRFATDIAKNSIPFQLSIVLQILIVNSRNCRMNSRWRLSVHTYRVAAQRSRILLWIVLLKQSLCDAQQWTVLFVSDLESQRDSVDYTAPVNRNMNASAADECANVRRNTHGERPQSVQHKSPAHYIIINK